MTYIYINDWYNCIRYCTKYHFADDITLHNDSKDNNDRSKCLFLIGRCFSLERGLRFVRIGKKWDSKKP